MQYVINTDFTTPPPLPHTRSDDLFKEISIKIESIDVVIYDRADRIDVLHFFYSNILIYWTGVLLIMRLLITISRDMFKARRTH